MYQRQENDDDSTVIRGGNGSGFAVHARLSSLTLGLSEEQEETLSGLLLSAEHSSAKLYEEGLGIDDRLTEILVQLDNKEEV